MPSTVKLEALRLALGETPSTTGRSLEGVTYGWPCGCAAVSACGLKALITWCSAHEDFIPAIAATG